MDNVIEFPRSKDKLLYRVDESSEANIISAVVYDGDEKLVINLDGTIHASEPNIGNIFVSCSKDELKDLMIMWLLMVDPDLINIEE